MARFRNPRYAPEFLEKRLHPSAVIAVVAEVARFDDPEPLPPPHGPGEPPPTPPILPGGPSVPY